MQHQAMNRDFRVTVENCGIHPAVSSDFFTQKRASMAQGETMNKKSVLIALVLLMALSFAWGQNTASATYTGGHVGSQNTTFDPGTSTPCTSAIPLTVQLPLGAVITSVDVSYSMTTDYAGHCVVQRSYVKCISTGGIAESSITNGYFVSNFDVPGTCNYSRSGLNIANGVTGGGNIQFELRHFIYAEDATYTNNNTFTVTVHYESLLTPVLFVAQTMGADQIKLSWENNNPSGNILIACNSSDTFVDPTDGVPYTAGSTLGTATILYAGSGTQYLHTGLAPLTRYYYKAWAYVDASEYSPSVKANGITPTTQGFPIIANFDGTVFPPIDWTNIQVWAGVWGRYTSGTPTPQTGAGMAGCTVLSMSNKKAYLSTPPLYFTGSKYRLTFKMYRDATYLSVASILNVYLNTTNSSTGGTLIEGIHRSMNLTPIVSSAGWYEYSYLLSDYGLARGDVRFIVFEAQLTARFGSIYIDEIKIEQVVDLPSGVNTAVDGVNLQPTSDLDIDTSIDASHPIVTDLASSISLGNTHVIGLLGSDNGVNINVEAPAGNWWASIYFGGTWHQASPDFIGTADVDRTFSFTGIDFGAKAGEVVILLNDGDSPSSTLPVELSSFSALLTAQQYVKLNWISESETNMLGYRIYRSDSANQSDALMITPAMVYATNTSSTAIYSYEDKEVSNGNTYYYWLEGVDMTVSQFFGPCQVLVQGENPPPIDEAQVTSMSSAFPNPFKVGSGTNINIQVKTGESGYVKIYNIHGQAVKTINIKEGFNPVSWDGRDSHGRPCGSGVYYYKLSTNSINKTMKMVLIK